MNMIYIHIAYIHIDIQYQYEYMQYEYISYSIQHGLAQHLRDLTSRDQFRHGSHRGHALRPRPHARDAVHAAGTLPPRAKGARGLLEDLQQPLHWLADGTRACCLPTRASATMCSTHTSARISSSSFELHVPSNMGDRHETTACRR